METTLILIKPDAVDRSIVGQIITRLENKWLKISGLKMMQLNDDIINEHYDFLMDKPFFPDLKAYMQRTPVVAIAASWVKAVATVRNLTWATNPFEAKPGSIRWDFGLTIDWNIIHASDTPENAEKELNRFFWWKDIFDYSKTTDKIL